MTKQRIEYTEESYGEMIPQPIRKKTGKIKAQSYCKEAFINHWQALKPNQDIFPMPIAYKHEGSTYDEDSIRITGSKTFIDSVLSHLKQLLDNENDDTRLQLVYKESMDKESGQPLNSWNCYIQVHERGQESRMMNAFIRGIKEKNFNKYRKEAENMMQEAMIQ